MYFECSFWLMKPAGFRLQIQDIETEWNAKEAQLEAGEHWHVGEIRVVKWTGLQPLLDMGKEKSVSMFTFIYTTSDSSQRSSFLSSSRILHFRERFRYRYKGRSSRPVLSMLLLSVRMRILQQEV